MTRYSWDQVMRRVLRLVIIGGFAATLAAAGTARAQTQIISCPYPISSPGTYVLAQDIGPCPGDGIDITASHVNLMLNGYIITGSGSSNGISARGPSQISNIQIQGPGLIQQFGNGISLQNVANSQIQKVVVATNSAYGIMSSNSTSLQFNANVATGNRQDGINLSNDTNDQVQQNETSGAPIGFSGIALLGGSGHQVHNNDVDANSCHGIFIASSNSQIHDNTVFGNGAGCSAAGIEVTSRGNIVHNNTAEGNQAYDLEDDNSSCDSNTWHNNTFFFANQPCIH
jgi:parallel beta-helix repeat protein